MQLSSITSDFLIAIRANNNRNWFELNKNKYLEAHDEVISFAEELLRLIKQHDDISTPSGKKSLQRIYRDIRFSKDKTPYKNNFGGGFSRATNQLRGGYYFHIQPGNSFAAGGFWGPHKDDLKLIREHIDLQGDLLKDILSSNNFTANFGSLLGEQLKTAPKGFPKEHPHIDLLRYKQFLVKKPFTDDQVFSQDPASLFNEAFEQMRPFFDCMTEYLITDTNGISLYQD